MGVFGFEGALAGRRTVQGVSGVGHRRGRGGCGPRGGRGRGGVVAAVLGLEVSRGRSGPVGWRWEGARCVARWELVLELVLVLVLVLV